MGMVSKLYNQVVTQNKTATNASLLKGQGLDLNTVLTPAAKRKKRAGLKGGDTEEVLTTLGV